ncbi:MAG TPA: hypothetical protein VFT50_18655 [Baekduia sp.]|nr:hypothetical protein [Baekduia sp.]
MRKTTLAWSACAAALLPALAATSAAADTPLTPAGALQMAGQAAASQQTATSSATSTQDHPTNTAIHVAILSPGASSGPVQQANTSNATSAAGNTNTTSQDVAQSGGGAGAGSQTAGQQAQSGQTAQSSAGSTQDHPTNTAIHVAILSPGASSGPVQQANTSNAGSQAGNTNTTRQRTTQSGGRGGGGVQAAGQAAGTAQRADSTATSTQDHPTNTAIDVAILSPADRRAVGGGIAADGLGHLAAPSGGVAQANTSNATSAAGNTNTTTQDVAQHGGGLAAPAFDGRSVCETCSREALPTGSGVQAAGQLAGNEQAATSGATSTQRGPLNLALGGAGGAVQQGNASSATSAAGNTNATAQRVRQAGAALMQAVGQQALNGQAADSHAASEQVCPANVAAAAGPFAQANTSGAGSAAGNTNGTTQDAGQGFGPIGPVVLPLLRS